MRKKIRRARAVAGLTGRIETIVVLIPRSDMRSPVDAEEYHDRPCRRPPIGQAKQGQANLLRRLQEECPSRPRRRCCSEFNHLGHVGRSLVGLNEVYQEAQFVHNSRFIGSQCVSASELE